MIVAAVRRLVHGDDGSEEHQQNSTETEDAQEDLETNLLGQVHTDEGRDQAQEEQHIEQVRVLASCGEGSIIDIARVTHRDTREGNKRE